MENMYKFDEIISLGYNCEVSFRIKDYFGKINSFPYSWAYCYNRDLFLESLKKLDEILKNNIELLPWSMFKDDKFDIAFHPKLNKENLFIKGSPEPNMQLVDESKRELIERINYLIKKMSNLFNSNKNSLFLIKVKNGNDQEDIDYIVNLYNVFEKLYLSKKYVLVIVIEKDFICNDILELENDRLKIRSVEKFAKDSETDTGGDLKGWGNIIKEFTCKSSFNYNIAIYRKHIRKITKNILHNRFIAKTFKIKY